MHFRLTALNTWFQQASKGQGDESGSEVAKFSSIWEKVLILRKTFTKRREQDVQGQVFVFPFFLLYLEKGEGQIQHEWAGENDEAALYKYLWVFLMETNICTESHAWSLSMLLRVTKLKLHQLVKASVEGKAPWQIFPWWNHQVVTESSGDTGIEERKLEVEWCGVEWSGENSRDVEGVVAVDSGQWPGFDGVRRGLPS